MFYGVTDLPTFVLGTIFIVLLPGPNSLYVMTIAVPAGESPRAAAGRPFRTSLLISLMNPKAILFFVAFFIQFVDPAYPNPVLPFLILGVIVQFFSTLYLSALIFGGAYLAEQFRRRRRLPGLATGGVGVLFMGFGLKLADATLG